MVKEEPAFQVLTEVWVGVLIWSNSQRSVQTNLLAETSSAFQRGGFLSGPFMGGLHLCQTMPLIRPTFKPKQSS